jgi:hypothetical protein
MTATPHAFPEMARLPLVLALVIGAAAPASAGLECEDAAAIKDLEALAQTGFVERADAVENVSEALLLRRATLSACVSA